LAERGPTLDRVLAAVEPRLLAAGFQNAGSDDSGTYAWVRFRRHERIGEQRFTRMITVAHAQADQAYLADSYVVSRDTHTQTPVARELKRYGSAAEAERVADELAAAVLGWVGA
jgi:hypothetical protein